MDEEKNEEIHCEAGDENVDLNEPEVKKKKMDAIAELIKDGEIPSSPEPSSTTPSKRYSRPKGTKEERETEKLKRAEERKKKEEERKKEKDRIAEEKRLEKERKDKEREEKKRKEEEIKEEKRKALELQKEAKRKEEEEKQRAKALKKEEEAAKKREEEEKKEAKRKEEQEEIKKKQRASQKFMGFFTKLDKDTAAEPGASEEKLEKVWYKPFKQKPEAVYAPIHRRSRLAVDADLTTQHDEVTAKTYLCSEAVKKRKLICARKDKLKTKLFQFHDNFRPPYYGTWKKRDKGIKPKKPWLPSSTEIDYEVDSDAEWENEPDDGDECKSDEEDPDVDEQQDSDADEFMVEPGYLSDGEGQEESDESNERDAEGRAERLAARATEWKRNVLNKSKVLIPVCVGPTFVPTSSLLAYPVYILP